MKSEKGITLIALAITIVVLVILAGVSIRIATKEDQALIDEAKKAQTLAEESGQKQNDLLDEYRDGIKEDETLSDEDYEELTVKNAQKIGMLNYRLNAEVYDEFGNKIIVPAGFKITTDADTVPEGIVIEDAYHSGTKGSQFVWIPVGKVYTSTSGDFTEIELNRYTFDYFGNYTAQGTALIDACFADAKEETVSTISGHYSAKDINAFLNNTKANGGYYIGRYEARKSSNGNVTNIKTDPVCVNIAQTDASLQSQAMYAENDNFTSDLINSYAWDTALVFLEMFDDREDTTLPYSFFMEAGVFWGDEFEKFGTDTDIVCNIYDMAANCVEFSTESCVGETTYTGKIITGFKWNGSSVRGNYSDVVRTPEGPPTRTSLYWTDEYITFRTILYL